MNTLLLKSLATLLLIFGEIFAIYAEMKGAKIYADGGGVNFLGAFSKMFLVMAVAGVFLIAGYMLGIRSFKNIWIPTVISIVSILIVEPIVAYAFFREMPTMGATIGFGLGVLGFLRLLSFNL